MVNTVSILDSDKKLQVKKTYLIKELAQQLGIEEEIGGGGELVGNSIKEYFRAVVFILFRSALLALDRHQTHAENVGTVTKESCFSTCADNVSKKSTSNYVPRTFC